mmetsp:Transcript_29478/g.47491  ORF Transcript_29478/g.47491 Transcript_29478/m.47491 type:complete len:110 (+) Transcript_29478:1097-1426(+)
MCRLVLFCLGFLSVTILKGETERGKPKGLYKSRGTWSFEANSNLLRSSRWKILFFCKGRGGLFRIQGLFDMVDTFWCTVRVQEWGCEYPSKPVSAASQNWTESHWRLRL